MEVKRMTTVQSVFMRFLLWFCGLAGLNLGIGLFLFLAMVAGEFILPANYGEVAFENNREQIQRAEKVTKEMIPRGCTYGVYSEGGQFLYGNIEEKDQEQIGKEYKKGNAGNGLIGSIGYLKYFPREKEICIGVYQLKVMYASPILREKLLPPAYLGIFFVVLFLIEALILVRKFSRAMGDELQNLKLVTEKVRQQDLEFERPKTKLREVDEVMDSLEQMKDALTQSLKVQWKMDEERRQQVSALVHDIKTPLTIIRGNTQLMQESESEEESKECQTYILQETERIEEYIQLLQEMLHSEGSLSVKEENINIKELVEEFEEQAQNIANANGQKVDITISNIPDYMKSDKRTLRRAWENLLSNALEYTPNGESVFITIKTEQQKLVFEDNGSGFSKEELCHASEQFYQGDKSRNSKNHYGMGLFMVQSFVKQCNATMELSNSGIHKGACVRLELPIE